MRFNLENVKKSYFDRNINLTLPESPSCELAEFMGILIGDGYMNKYGKYFSLLEIAGDSRLDKEYLENYVSKMIKKLFNLEPKVSIKTDQNLMVLRLMSKGINNYLQEIGFKSGKKGEIGIPLWIKDNDEYMNYFIKGLADTDGCLTLLNKKQKDYIFYPRVQISSRSLTLLRPVCDWLKEHKFPVCEMKDHSKRTHKGVTKIHMGYRFNINGTKQLERWMYLIGFRNKRHLDKCEKFKESGNGGI